MPAFGRFCPCPFLLIKISALQIKSITSDRPFRFAQLTTVAKCHREDFVMPTVEAETNSTEQKSKPFYSSFHSDEPEVEKSKKAQALKNIGILLCGTVLPTLLISAYATACFERIARLLIKHPLETLLESALVAAVPLLNYMVWRAIQQQDGRFAMRRGILNGLSVGTSAVIATICGAALFLDYPTKSPADNTSYEGAFMFLMSASWVSCITSIYLANEMRRMWEFRSSRIRCVTYSIIGALLSVVSFLGCEARPTMIRIAEQMALSHTRTEHDRGLEMLRSLNAERDLIMEGADPRTAGLPGLFLHIDPQYMKPLYFAVTGKPYRAENEVNWSTLSDDYLKRHLVGVKEEGLSLLRSSMNSQVHPKTLSSSTSWTFVFSNDQYQEKEIRAEIGLPPGAVVTGLSSWVNGSRKQATFTATGEVPMARQIIADHQEPAIVTDLGRGRVLLHCFPVAGHSELKVQLNMVTPLKSDGIHSASMTLPRIIESNFAIAGDHKLQMTASHNSILTMSASKEQKSNAQGTKIVRTLDNDELSNAGLFVDVSLPAKFEPVDATNPFSRSFPNIFESIQQISAHPPETLVVVLDGSVAVRPHYKEIRDALSKLPSNVSASLLLARDDGHLKTVPLAQGLASLSDASFAGGQDNLEAVVQGAEVAGESRNGAMLWIHGPQPGYSKEIYIMSPFAAKPKFFELPLDNGETDTREFLKNHEEILPVAAVPRTGSIKYDVQHFLDRWTSGDSETSVAFASAPPAAKHYVATRQESREVAALWANQRVQDLIGQHRGADASAIALEHQILTPVSLAAVFDDATYNRYNLRPSGNGPFGQDAFSAGDTRQPMLQGATNGPIGSSQSSFIEGATNGTIGPQAGEGYVVSGVNTAGTVRVNNLANLEALLNIFANGAELLGLLFGSILLFGSLISSLSGSQQRATVLGIYLPISNRMKMALGVAMILAGLATPGFINYMVCSARDANLFA
jgi:hypothetical protein